MVEITSDSRILLQATPDSAYKRRSASFGIFDIGAIVVALLMTVVTHAQRGNSSIYVDQHVVVVGLDKIHGVSLTGTVQRQMPIFSVQSGTVLSNINLLVFTEDLVYQSPAVLEPIKKQYTFKALIDVTTGHRNAVKKMVTSPFGTHHNGCILSTQTVTACNASSSFRFLNQCLSHQKATKNSTVSGDFISMPIPTAFYNQRSPLEKHNRFFSLPPPVTT